MYWGQVMVSLVLAVSGAYTTYARGRSALEAALFGVVFYFLIRWLIAWAFRIRYWYHRGTRGVYTQYCPNCNRRRHRLSGDWMLTCRRCGWKPGWVGIRWVTKSMPAQQLRRTVVGPQLVVAIAAIAVLMSGAASGLVLQGALPEDQLITEGTTPDQPAGVSTAESTRTSTATPTSTKSGLDLRVAEQEILDHTNRVRSNFDLRNLSWSPLLHERALKHSRDMGQFGYYSHEGPNGESATSRLSRISDQCGSASSENIHRGEVRTEMRIYGSSETVFMTDPQSIARYGVQGWMNSPGHRENMLDERWTHAGVGLYTTESGEIFMTILFC